MVTSDGASDNRENLSKKSTGTLKKDESLVIRRYLREINS